MKTLVYVIYVIALVAFFLTAVCVVHGNMTALIPLGIEALAIFVLGRASHERG